MVNCVNSVGIESDYDTKERKKAGEEGERGTYVEKRGMGSSPGA